MEGVGADHVTAIIAADRYAPSWHFLAPEGTAVPFDPNGALWWKGRYHLFYIFQDPDLPHGGHCWGHASSADLVNWEFHPTALAPAPGDPDTGIFSGGAFVDKEGVPTIIYHGVGAGTCLARATDDELIGWEKHPANPVIPIPAVSESGHDVYNVFDPHCWLEGDTYYAILGGKVKPFDLRDTAYLFTSKDLSNWTYLRPFYAPHPHWTGEEEDCACPDFFAIGDRHCLLCISHPRGARYYLGRWQDQTFVPEEHHRMNWPGGGCFAPESLLDGDGRRLMWAWAIEGRRGMLDADKALGVMTMPRVLDIGADGGLRITPAPELERLRGSGWSGQVTVTETAQELPLQSDSLELDLQLVESSAGALRVSILRTPDAEQRTDVIVDFDAGELRIDTSQSGSEDAWRPYPIVLGVDPEDHPVQVAPFTIPLGESLRLRIFVDRSIVEVFANERLCMTGRCYPSRKDATSVAISGSGSGAIVAVVEAWPLAG